MENTQLSLLTALFGGKAPGAGLAAAHTFATGGDAQKDPQGFFAFLEGLVSQSGKTDEGIVNVSPEAAGPRSFHGLNSEKLQELLGDSGPQIDNPEVIVQPIDAGPFDAPLSAPEALGVAAPENSVIALPESAAPEAASALSQPTAAQKGPGIAAPLVPAKAPASTTAGAQLGATTSNITKPLGVGPAAPEQPTTRTAPASAVDAPGIIHPLEEAPGEPAPLVRTAQPANGGQQGGAATVTATVTAAQPAASQAASPAVAAETQTAADGETTSLDSVEQDMLPETGRRDGETLLDDAPLTRGPLKMTGQASAPTANAVAAIAEHAAPEALAHSALTRDEAASAAEVERIATTRHEAAVQAGERNAHLNPIRDQIVAAVAARPGEARLEVRLDPPELGRVMIGFEGDGADLVRAVITADSPETLDLMRRNADVFQRALEQQGFSNLDLQFADSGARDNAGEDAGETQRYFSLNEEDAAMTTSPEDTGGLINGRLDRRL